MAGWKLFEEFAEEYRAWAKVKKRSWLRDHASLKALEPFLRGRLLDEITQLDVRRYVQAQPLDLADRAGGREVVTSSSHKPCSRNHSSLSFDR